MVRQRIHGILRASERLTGTDMVYLARGGFWLGAAQAGAAAAAFGLSLVMARYVSAEVFGSYKFLGSLGAIFGAISLTGFATSVVRSVARGHGGTVRGAFAETLRWSWPGIGVALAVAAYYAVRGNLPYALAVALIGLALPITGASSLYTSYLTGLKNFRLNAGIWTAANLVTVGLTAAAAIWSGKLLWLVVAAYAGSAAATYLAYRASLAAVPPVGGDDPESRNLGRHLSAISFLDTLAANADKIIVFQFLGPAATAAYVFAMGIPEQGRALLKSGARLAVPRMAERPFAELQATTPKKVFRFAAAGVVLCAAYAFAAPSIFSVLFPAYVESAKYSSLLGFAMISALGQVPMAALSAHAKTRELYRYSASVASVRIVAHLTLIAAFGMWGAVASTLIGHAAMFAVPLYLLKRAR
jgi:O-antigen/teichoic acid export membrane protein